MRVFKHSGTVDTGANTKLAKSTSIKEACQVLGHANEEAILDGFVPKMAQLYWKN